MSANEPRAAALLDEVHAVLLRQDYDGLAQLAASLEQELDHPSQTLDAEALAIIRRKADRNALTLLAVQRGIRAAVRRITEIRSVANGLVTYDLGGRREEKSSGSDLKARY
ncbi:hypothetical protein GC209_00555 [bacterium]|nr:hypothetical protein [bacterium]